MTTRFVTLLAASAMALALTTGAMAQVAIGFGGTPHDEDQPVEVTADSLRVDQSSGLAVFEGNVVVIQGDLRLAAAEVQINYDDEDGEQRVSEVLASGGVLMTRGEDAAEGSEAVYDVDTTVLTMEGDVLVTQGSTAISGDRLIVNIDTGTGTVEGNVRTVLQPGGSE